MLKKDYVKKTTERISSVLSEHPGNHFSVSGSPEGTMPIRITDESGREVLLFFADAAYERFATGREDYEKSVSWFLDKTKGLFI